MFLLPQTTLDYLELFICIYASYRVLNWLQKDKQSPLLRYTLSCITILTIAYVAPLPIISYGLLYVFPLLSCLTVIFHTSK